MSLAGPSLSQVLAAVASNSFVPLTGSMLEAFPGVTSSNPMICHELRIDNRGYIAILDGNLIELQEFDADVDERNDEVYDYWLVEE